MRPPSERWVSPRGGPGGSQGGLDGPGAALGFRYWPFWLTAVAVCLLAITGILPHWPGLVQQAGIGPLDQVADMRVLLAESSSWAWFALGTVLDVLVRSWLLAAALGGMRRIRLAVEFTAASLVPALVSAELAYSGQAILYAVLAWVGIGVAVLAVLAMAALPWRSERGLLAGAAGSIRRGACIPTVAAYLLAMGALGYLVRRGGEPAELAGVLVSAALSVLTARHMAGSRTPVAPARLATVAVMGALCVALVAAGLVGAKAPPGVSRATGSPGSGTRAAGRAPGTLFVVPGIDTSSGHGSAFEIDPALLGFSCSHTVYYSYAGPGKGASQQQAVCPIRSGAPYSRTDTGRPLGVLAEYLVEQLRALRSPVTVVTHSSGSWVLWAALLDDRDLPVTRVVLLAPLWGSIGYPMAGVEAPGLPGAAGMRLIVRLGRDIHFTTFRPSEPLARTLLAVPGYASSLLARRVPRRIRVIAIQSWFDLVVVGRPVTFEGIVPGCPVLVPHGAVPTSGAAMSQAAAFLSGARRPGCGWWSRLSADLTYSFRVP